MLRWIVDRIGDIDFRGDDWYINENDVIVLRGHSRVYEVTKKFQKMLLHNTH